jgi:hypothetical protein
MALAAPAHDGLTAEPLAAHPAARLGDAIDEGIETVQGRTGRSCSTILSARRRALPIQAPAGS